MYNIFFMSKVSQQSNEQIFTLQVRAKEFLRWKAQQQKALRNDKIHYNIPKVSTLWAFLGKRITKGQVAIS